MMVIAASGGVSICESNTGISMAKRLAATDGLMRIPPSTVPKIMEPTVSPSIQPLAATNFSGGSNSVNMPYLAGEYAAAPNPTIA